MPWSRFAASMHWITFSIRIGLMPASGSSSSTSSGSGISIVANCSSFCWPPDMLPAGRCATRASPETSISSRARSRRALTRARDFGPIEKVEAMPGKRAIWPASTRLSSESRVGKTTVF